jgi:transcriptional regulator with XRE-family HTH domain
MNAKGVVKMIADRIKSLREQKNMTQADLAKQLGITRSSVNAWEMGISVPSTQYIVELSEIFNVSTDYLLGVQSSATISIQGLSDNDAKIVHALIAHLREKNNGNL